MFCAACGEKVFETAIVCPKCGSPVNNKQKQGGEVSSGLLVGGYLGALFFPLVGIIIGILVATKGKVGHGIGQIVLSIFMSIIFLSMMIAASNA